MGVFLHKHVQCATWINYRISTCNFIADWMIVLENIYIAGLALVTSLLATTDFPEHSYQPGPDFIFSKCMFWKKSVIQGSFEYFWFSKWPFLHHNEAEDAVFCHTCMKMVKEKKNKTYTKADPVYVSSA